MMRTTRILACLLTLAAGAAQPAAAQATDARWQAFFGCWAPVSQDGAEAPEHVVCFRPTNDATVRVVTIAGDDVRGEETILTDGAARPVQEEACRGTESARWSADGARIYLRSSLQCGENVLGRETAGVLALAGGGTFIDVQAVGVDDQYGVRVLQYRSIGLVEYPAAMRDLAAYADDATRLYAAAPLSLDDIVEASQALPAPAAQAMLASLPASRVHVDADALLALSQAGVSDEVIDMVVALAHPEKFAVATAPLQGTEDDLTGRNVWMTDSYYDPFMGYGYGRYDRYGYNSYYSPFGYGRSYGWGYQPGTIIIVDRDDDDDDGASAGRGAIVKGRGYTRVGERGTGTQATEPRSTSPRPSVDRSTRSTGSSAAPSSSGGSTSTRKAQPRNPPDR